MKGFSFMSNTFTHLAAPIEESILLNRNEFCSYFMFMLKIQDSLFLKHHNKESWHEKLARGSYICFSDISDCQLLLLTVYIRLY